MSLNEKFCFEISNSSIDISQCISYLNSETWSSYTQFDEKYQGFYGIGLTSFEKSDSPELDSLKIYQDISRTRNKKESDINWQLMTNHTHHVHDYIKELFDRFKFLPHRARFAKIDPGKKIALHTDDYTENITRVHWPIITNSDNIMLGHNLDTKKIDRYYFESGKCYAINTNVLHGVINNSTLARVHLIVNFGISFEELKSHAKSGLFKS
jgi:hypothetical protein